VGIANSTKWLAQVAWASEIGTETNSPAPQAVSGSRCRMMAYNRTQPVISMFAMSIREHPILESHQAAVDIYRY
jgi:NADH pyrophosphatase NudC (nudix superfamily)